MKCRLFFLFLLPVFLLHAKPPNLSNRDAKIKIEEILKAHVSYQKLTPEIVSRAFGNYLDEVDPTKTYFLAPEIEQWTTPSQDLIDLVLDEYKRDNFSVFEQIHTTALQAIERRGALEKQIDISSLPTGVQVSEFKEMKWVKTQDELLERIQRIRALQLGAADKLEEKNKENFLKQLEKRRVKREEELIGANQTERRQIILATVLKAISSSLDSQTAYFTPKEASQFMIQVQQKLSGIGAQLRDDLTGLTIVRLIEGGPAVMGKQLKVGDRIIAVNAQPIIGMEISESVELIRGKPGTNVTLTLLRETTNGDQKSEEKLEFSITRGEVILNESRYETTSEPFGDGIIAHLKLYSFYQDDKASSALDLSKELQRLSSDHKIKGVILDLRNNGGGLLSQAVAVSALFIKKGVVVSVKDNTGRVQHLRNFEGRPVWDGPLVILTNKASASASEIVAQTLQDYGRAFVVGDATSFGKGTFQTFTLEATSYNKVNPKGEYKVTRGRYYTVSGKSPQLEGVKADIVIPGLLSTVEFGEEFSKYPVETDEIPPSFHDTLEDLNPNQRSQLLSYYQHDRQEILSTYQPFLPFLKENTKWRLENNQNYQNFLKEIEKKEFASEPVEFFGQADLQFAETLNVMKDLIIMIEEEKRSPQN